MRVAVVGGGTAGYMAAAHLTRELPVARLHHIYDSRLPAIGVGEGTTPPFANWVHDTLGLGAEELRDGCGATRKDGIRFEGWGSRNPEYWHFFSTREGSAYHVAADRVTDLLGKSVDAIRVDARVTELASRRDGVRIRLADGEVLDFDYAVDARGFPALEPDRHRVLDGVPTNRALVRRSHELLRHPWTRAVARPHGWIFVIPLAHHTSYGYVYDGCLVPDEEVRSDFDRFLSVEGVSDCGHGRSIGFPNFADRTPISGSVFTIGNAAGFLEPLEATAIGLVVVQLRYLTCWLLDRQLRLTAAGGPHALPDLINRRLRRFMASLELFVSWHYALGSAFDTPFWRSAQVAFRRRLATAPRSLRREFERFVASGARLPRDLAFVADRGAIDGVRLPDFPTEETFGGFVHDSFAKVGHGIAFYEQREPRPCR